MGRVTLDLQDVEGRKDCQKLADGQGYCSQLNFVRDNRNALPSYFILFYWLYQRVSNLQVAQNIPSNAQPLKPLFR